MTEQAAKTVTTDDFTLWAHSKANSLRHPHDSLHDDLVQEALIAIWEKQQATPDASPSLLVHVGYCAMVDLLRSGTATGSRHGGRHYRPRFVADLEDVEPPAPPVDVDARLDVTDGLRRMRPTDAAMLCEWAAGVPQAEIAARYSYSTGKAVSRRLAVLLPRLREAVSV